MRILVVAPHPDDETLGCGGTLLKHKANGDELFWLIVTHALTDKGYKEQAEQIEEVKQQYKFSGTKRMCYPECTLDETKRSEIVSDIDDYIKGVRPNIIYLPFIDVHSDHRVSFESSVSCVKWFNNSFVEQVLCYETLSSTEYNLDPSVVFVPNVFVDTSEFMEHKLQIMKLYKTELKVNPHPRSLGSMTAQSTLRGSQIGCDSAEAFMLLKGRR